MNKLYGLLIAAVICSAASGLVASEGPLKPFFDQKTQVVVKNTAKNYALGYAGIYGVATGLAWSTRNLHIIKPSFSAIAGEFNSAIYKPITRSILFTAPVVFGSILIHHKCQSLRERNAA